MKRRKKSLKVFRVFIFDRKTEKRHQLLEEFRKKLIRKINRVFFEVKVFLIKNPSELQKKMQNSGSCFIIVDISIDTEDRNILSETLNSFCKEIEITTIGVNLSEISQPSP